MFGRTPSKSVNPDEAVAMGAAIQVGVGQSLQIFFETSSLLSQARPSSNSPFVLFRDGHAVGGHSTPLCSSLELGPVTAERNRTRLAMACFQYVVFSRLLSLFRSGKSLQGEIVRDGEAVFCRLGFWLVT